MKSIANFFSSVEQKMEPKADNTFDKFSFDDAADPFADDQNVKKTNGNDGNNNFDPFAAPVLTNITKKETSIGFGKETSSGFGFDADFANFDSFNDTPTNGNGKPADAWGGSLDKTNNNVGKVKKFNVQEISRIGKFSGDYSDNDRDLQEILKRSVMEQ